jgi:hypothetical protein
MLRGALLFVDLSPVVFAHGPEEAARIFASQVSMGEHSPKGQITTLLP